MARVYLYQDKSPPAKLGALVSLIAQLRREGYEVNIEKVMTTSGVPRLQKVYIDFATDSDAIMFKLTRL